MLVALDLGIGRAGLLGSMNTGGYLLGALVSHRILSAVGYRRGFYLAAFLQCATLLLMAVAPPFWVMSALRLAQGALGAMVFVGGAALVMASGGRALALGLYFGSIGVGIAVSTAVIPLASDWQAAWVWLGLLALALSGLALSAWPRLAQPAAPSPTGPRGKGTGPVLAQAAEGSARAAAPAASSAAGTGTGTIASIWPALLSYGLYGAGYIAYMTFVTNGLSVGTGPFWLLLGVGATLNGPVWGPISGRLKGPAAQVLVLAALLISSLPALITAVPYASAILFGLSFLGVITAITELIRERLPASAWPRAMALSTAAFAAGQAVGPALAGAVGEAIGGAAHGATVALYAGSALLAVALVAAVISALVGARRQRPALSE